MKRYGVLSAVRQLRIDCDKNVKKRLYAINPNDKGTYRKLVDTVNMTIAIDNDLFGIMDIANKMVKDKVNCSGNRCNRFYDLKHKVIKKALKFGLIDNAIDNGEYYLFTINGHEFHQPKFYYDKEIVNVNGSETYVPSTRDVTFDYDTYKLAISTMAFFISTYDLNEKFVNRLTVEVDEYTKCRQELIDMLHRLDEGKLRFFKRLWANNNLDISIEEAIDNLDIKKLSIIYCQAKNTLKKI